MLSLSEPNIPELCDNNKHSNILMIEILEKEERKRMD